MIIVLCAIAMFAAYRFMATRRRVFRFPVYQERPTINLDPGTVGPLVVFGRFRANALCRSVDLEPFDDERGQMGQSMTAKFDLIPSAEVEYL